MLNLELIESQKQKTDYFKNTDLNKKTWVVSDLTTKLFLQKKIFEKNEVIDDESLLRASELWKKLINRLRPDLKIISQDSAILILTNYLKNKEDVWVSRPGVPKTIIEYTQALSSVLSHDNSHEIMKDFFKKNTDSFQKWGHWYLLAHECYHYLLLKKMIIIGWVPGILVNETHFAEVWKRDIVIDLGTQLLPIEAEVLQSLSKEKNIDVLMPSPKWFRKYHSTLKQYEVLKPGIFSENKEESSFENYNHEFLKVSTELSEVQIAVARVRKILDEKKCQINEIGIVAPDIGKYWPALKFYLDVEGIESGRAYTGSNISFPEIQFWLSKLKIESQKFEYTDLEMSEASGEAFLLKYEKFKSLFFNIYSSEDLKRSELISKKYSNKTKIKNVNNKDFFVWAIHFWQENWPTERLKLIVDKLFSEFSEKDNFELSAWIEMLEKILSKTDSIIHPGGSNGIHCLDLISLRDLDLKYVFILGTTDESLRTRQNTLISESDISFIKQNYGFFISEAEKMDLDFELRWNLENKDRNYTLFYAQSNFDGNTQAPSILWLKGAIAKDKKELLVTSIEENRLLELQNASLEVLKDEMKWTDSELNLYMQQISEDKGEAPHVISNMSIEKLSASQIEDYLKCPLIHASKKLFCLDDLPDLDLDVDYMTRGKILHALAESVHKDAEGLLIPDSRISEIYDLVVKDLEVPIFNKKMWDAQKNKYLKMIKDFIRFEKEWKNQFKDVVNIEVEKDFEIYLDMDSFEITTKANKNTIIMRGRIDRVDYDKNKKACVVIDYKYDTQQHTNYGSWIQNNQLQLALYSYIVENGGLGAKVDVLGAIYYGFKKLDREKGFLLEEADGYLYSIGNRRANKLNVEKKATLYQELMAKIKSTVESIKKGEYQAIPADIKTCNTCKWKKICRAPHLN